MATKQEIIEGIRQSEERVEQTFRSLTPEQLATPVQEGGEHWTAKHVLAHLASRGDLYASMTQVGQGTAPAGGFDIDELNRREVNARLDRSVDDLLAEFRQAHDGLIRQVEAMPDDALQREVPFGRGNRPLGDLLLMGGGTHSVMHVTEVEQALGLS